MCRALQAAARMSVTNIRVAAKDTHGEWHFCGAVAQVEQLRRQTEEQAAHVERLQAARLTAEAELLHARDEVDSLHAALRCGEHALHPRQSRRHSPSTQETACNTCKSLRKVACREGRFEA